MLILKNYQQDALDQLKRYLRLCVERNDVDLAFYECARRQYSPVDGILGPYVCLKIPTGGGKTLMACHAIAIAANELQKQDNSLVLWLVPTNTIKDQTLKALKDRSHSYRQALDATLDAKVRVVDVEEAQQLQRSVLDNETVIIVTTLANPRVGETDKRKIYEQNGSLMAHFDGLSDIQLVGLQKYEGSDTPIPSLANIIQLRKPIVVMDEAHNARTELAFETLSRFDPSCILEFTATPAEDQPNPSNVLCRVSANELKSEDMIKLPIMLERGSDWQQTLLSAKNKRDQLEELAKAETRPGIRQVRPIILLQSQKKNEEITVDRIYECLRNDMGIPEEQIAVETGERQDLKEVDLFAANCQIRYIITIDKLREGWDCSFAYVLCSVRDMGSKTAVEQILGRILRMPDAKRRTREELNRAYAFVTSARMQDIGQTLDVIAKGLEDNGFTKEEARAALHPVLTNLEVGVGCLFTGEQAAPSPAGRGEKFEVPQLCLWMDDELVPLDEDYLLQAPWNLTGCEYELSEAEFPTRQQDIDLYEIDINDAGKVKTHRIAWFQQHLAMILPCDIKSKEQLSIWLDRHIPHPDIPQPQSMLFLLKLVEHLADDRGIPLEDLARRRLDLRIAAEKKIQEHRKKASSEAIEGLLLPAPLVELKVSAERVFSYPQNQDMSIEPYIGRFTPNKHYYHQMGSMNGEEARCAEAIDSLPNVKYWVRNIERRQDTSFWLQTCTDKFYPDFLVLLEDGRVAAIEYKGEHIDETPDSIEKCRLGELWATRSEGKCVFLWVTAADYQHKINSLAN